ncbi:MAG TPA: lipoprotein [Candidatus Thermoplasmatota archaeon]|nr:lipoprotein [Candidatus Thermoplasmatota archaeon]
MRRVLALALIALVLSGCSTATSDDPTPPNADPNGQQTLPPAGPGSASTAPPTATNSSSGPASASASQTSAPNRRPPSFAAHDAEDSATDPDFPSLFVAGHLQGSGPQLRIESTANNMGERDYRVPDGACQQAWSETLRGPDGKLVQQRKPLSTCAAFGLKPFPAHEFLSTALTWNGTLWDAASSSFVTAPAGTYVWTVTFDVYSGGSGAQYDDHAAMALTFEVKVP